ncbi:hypothetical protein [Streptomyces capillispiralis]|uniref:hypothetical protein n=1 Tax=Streptomyces capillispiralis TaxID=68182 RepID=UPI001674D0C4|nr:hypothetical protein [Streptomyces capillispiralis]GHH95732.1 hypothetical protein GCM10017779_61890 [Streptomyces capillispiralis]
MHVNARVIVTGKLRSYGAVRREVMPSTAGRALADPLAPAANEHPWQAGRSPLDGAAGSN